MEAEETMAGSAEADLIDRLTEVALDETLPEVIDHVKRISEAEPGDMPPILYVGASNKVGIDVRSYRIDLGDKDDRHARAFETAREIATEKLGKKLPVFAILASEAHMAKIDAPKGKKVSADEARAKMAPYLKDEPGAQEVLLVSSTTCTKKYRLWMAPIERDGKKKTVGAPIEQGKSGELESPLMTAVFAGLVAGSLGVRGRTDFDRLTGREGNA